MIKQPHCCLGAIKQRHQIRHSLGSNGSRFPFHAVGSNIERLKARFFALGVGRNLWKPYLSPSDCRKQDPAWRMLGWVGET